MTKQDTLNHYNKTRRRRLCEFTVKLDVAKTVEPAFKRLVDEYGSKIDALCKAVIDADRALTKSKEDVR